MALVCYCGRSVISDASSVNLVVFNIFVYTMHIA